MNGINILPFIRKGEKVPYSTTKDMRSQFPDQTQCCFTILEGEDLENGLSNVKIGEFFLNKDVFRPGDELNCTLNLDRAYMLYATAFSENMRNAMGKEQLKAKRPL